MATVNLSQATQAFQSRFPWVWPGLQKPRIRPHNVTANVEFYNPDSDDPTPVVDALNHKAKAASYGAVKTHRDIMVYDIRGTESQYSLEKTGFQVVKHQSALITEHYHDIYQYREEYFRECEQLLKQATGASRVIFFDQKIRKSTPAAGEENIGESERQQRVQKDLETSDGKPYVIVNQKTSRPLFNVHVDQTEGGALDRVRYHMQGEANELLKGRWQILNIWRPLRTVLKDPLAVADANSVHDDELVPIKVAYPHRVGELYSVKPTKPERTDAGQRFYYLHKQRSDEVLIFKCFESKRDGRPRRCAHTAFKAVEYENEPDRESIEVRALVFYDDNRD